MSLYFRSITLAISLLLLGHAARANHIFGVDFYYEYVSGTTYRISMAIYGDCAAISNPSAPINLLPTASPQVQLLNGNTLVQVVNLNVQTPAGEEVTPVCPREKLNTTCNGGTIDGVIRYIYSNTVNIGTTSANWRFHFTGELGNSQAGRSNQISNISGAGGSIIALDISLNNTLGPNSSPRFTTIPTPFYCINIPAQYNQGAVDPNNDSLGYALVPGITPNGTNVTYIPPYSATNPLSAVTGTFSFNAQNGQLNFTPDLIQRSLVVNKVTEYRNGVAVGSAVRELTFIVRSNCTGNAPTSSTDTATTPIIGGVQDGGTTVNICEGTPSVHFGIKPVDVDGDTINVVVTGLPAGASAVIQNNDTRNPTVIVDWNTASIAPGFYFFYLTFKDNGCPLSSQQTQVYTMRVVRPNAMTYKTIYPTECAHKALLEYQLSYGLTPRTVEIRQGSTLVRSFTTTSDTYQDSLGVGTYLVHITSPLLSCPTDMSVTVRDSGTYPYPPVVDDAFYCLNDPPVPMVATPVTGGTVHWYDSLQRSISTAPVPSTAVAGIFRYYASQLFKVCESRMDTGLVYVTKRPVADFVTPPEACTIDTVLISFSGTIGVGPILDYKWGWGDGSVISGQGEGPYRVNWHNPGIKTIKLQVFENKCPSDSIEKQIRIKPTPVADFIVNNVCQYDSVMIKYTVTDTIPGQQYAWQFEGADIPSSNDRGPFRIHWPTHGTKRVFLEVSKDGCRDTTYRFPVINPAPEAFIFNIPGAVCLGDKIYLIHAGTDPYKWEPKNKILFDHEGKPYTYVTEPTTYTLIVNNEYNCVDSSSISYTKIDPCCLFSYPTAFTPNGDQRNDKFRVITYGNDQSFSLTIFNRWGQPVYHSGNPQDGWDGRLNGKDCDMGTYYYILNAKCLTGYEENRHGEFELIR